MTEMRLKQQYEVLVVDDLPENLLVLSQTLKALGCRVRAAKSGRAALASIAESVPDLVLMDVRMSDMNGYETCRRIKAAEHSQHLPVIFISALNETEDVVRGFEVGGVDYIAKPFRVQEVRARVRNQLLLVEQKRARERSFRTLQEMRNVFMRNATHDLKTPLTTILGYLQLMRYGLEQPKQLMEELPDFLEKLNRNAERLREIIQGILELAQLETGRQFDLTRRPVLPFYRSIRYQLEGMGQGRNVTVVFESFEEPDVWVRIDEKMLARAIENLISNGVKYTPSNGRVRIFVSAQKKNVCLGVADTGMGIAADQIARLGEPFYRLPEVEEQGIGGSGLGLSIVKTIVDQHGGRLDIESRVGEGSTFAICLPRVASPQSESESQRA